MNILIIDIVGVVGTPLFNCFLVKRDTFIGIDSAISHQSGATTLFANQRIFRFNGPNVGWDISYKEEAIHWVMYFASRLDYQKYLFQGSAKACLGNFFRKHQKYTWRSVGTMLVLFVCGASMTEPSSSRFFPKQPSNIMMLNFIVNRI